jgi:2'-aminobiphenyl-2,3-diol 1,2-dioxygenase large subunit
MGLQPPFAVGVADEYVPFGDMDIPREPFPGHRAFAEAFVERAAERGFDLAKAEEYAPDHGVALPLLFANPERRVPVVPILVNINMQPIPAPKRCVALAGVLRDSIERDLPAGTRAVVLGAGGLSHWLNVPGMGTVNTAFDREVLDKFLAGRSNELAALSVADIVKQGGNGGIEILTWMMAAATCPGAPGEEIYYEAMPEWFTGMGGIALRL